MSQNQDDTDKFETYRLIRKNESTPTDGNFLFIRPVHDKLTNITF